MNRRVRSIEKPDSTSAAAEARRAYQRKWRAANKEKVREYNLRFWEKQAQKLEEQANKKPSE